MKHEALISLQSDLKSKTGIDFVKYRNDNTLEVISKIVTFPIYAQKTMIFPVLIFGLVLLSVSALCFISGRTFLSIILFLHLSDLVNMTKRGFLK